MHEDVVAPPGPPPVADAPRRPRQWPAWVAGALVVLVVVALVAAAFIRVPYVIITPGDATALDRDVLDVRGAPTYDHNGELLYLTVSVNNKDPNLYRYLFAKLASDTSVQKRERVIGCASYEASTRLAIEEMNQSQDVAKAVALRKLGYEVPTDAERVEVIDVLCGGPSDGRLELGDFLVAVDGTPVTSAGDVKPLVVAHQPGDTVVFTVDRGGVQQDVRVKLGKNPSDGSAYAGIISQTDAKHQIPVDIGIDTARVSGPSAGLAFTLAIIDRMTPGDLTGGGDVAVTGAINEDGSVGPVGGVAQKAVTARRAGAKLMLVPVDEVKDARRHAGNMKVVGVRNVDDALAALADIGGAPIAAPAAAAQ